MADARRGTPLRRLWAPSYASSGYSLFASILRRFADTSSIARLHYSPTSPASLSPSCLGPGALQVKADRSATVSVEEMSRQTLEYLKASEDEEEKVVTFSETITSVEETVTISSK